MNLTYEINVNTDSTGKPTDIEINGMKIPFNSKRSILSNINNAIFLFHRENELKDGTYNRAVFWPVELEMKVNQAMNIRYQIELTNHARQRIEENNLPTGCYKALLYGEVIEAEVQDGKIVKIVTRIPNKRGYNQDICAAIILIHEKFQHFARVKTVWTNNAYDVHQTIDTENYVQEDEMYA